MKVFFFFPFIVDRRLQFTSKNELARSFCKLGNTMSICVGYKYKKVELDGFTNTTYVNVRYSIKKLFLYFVACKKAVFDCFDVILVPDRLAFFIPVLKILLFTIGKKKLIVSDIRTIPVDLPKGVRGEISNLRFKFSVIIIDRFSDGLTVITPAVKDFILPLLKHLKNNVGIWSSGVNIEVFKLDGDNYKSKFNLMNKKTLIYHGDLSPNRGLQNLLRSLKILNSSKKEFFLIIMGAGNGKERLKQISRDEDIIDSVLFLNPVKYEEVPKILRTADCGVLPFPDIIGWRVSSPLKLMEYIALNLKIVATNITAHKFVKSNFKDLILTDGNSPVKLAEGIKMAFRAKEKNVDFNLIQKKISWDSQAKELHKYIKNL